MSLWLVIARGAEPDNGLRARLDAACGVVASLDERLAQAGVGGVAGALDAGRRLAHVLAVADAERLAALRAASAALQDELGRAAAMLAALRALKERVETVR